MIGHKILWDAVFNSPKNEDSRPAPNEESEALRQIDDSVRQLQHLATRRS